MMELSSDDEVEHTQINTVAPQDLGVQLSATETRLGEENHDLGDLKANDEEEDDVTIRYLNRELIRKCAGIAPDDPLTTVKVLRVHLPRGAGKIKTIEQLGMLKNLEELDLSYNVIKVLENVGHLRKLVKLNLAENRIRTMQLASLEGLERLEHLNLSGNRLQRLPKGFGDALSKLKVLRLARNRFEDLSVMDELEKLPMLTNLALMGNPLSSLKHHIDYAVFKLKTLDIFDGQAVTMEMRKSARERYERPELERLSGLLAESKGKLSVLESERRIDRNEMDRLRKSNQQLLDKLAELGHDKSNLENTLSANASILDKSSKFQTAMANEVSEIKQYLLFKRIDGEYSRSPTGLVGELRDIKEKVKLLRNDGSDEDTEMKTKLAERVASLEDSARSMNPSLSQTLKMIQSTLHEPTSRERVEQGRALVLGEIDTSEAKTLQEIIQDQSRQLELLRNQVEVLELSKNQIDKLKRETASHRLEKIEMMNNMRRYEDKIAEMENKVMEGEDTLIREQQSKEDLRNITEEYERLRVDLEDMAKQLESGGKFSFQASDANPLAGLLQHLFRDISKTKADLLNLQEKLRLAKKQESEIDKIQIILPELRLERAEVEDRIKSATREIATLERRKHELEKQVEELEGLVATANARHSRLQEKIRWLDSERNEKNSSLQKLAHKLNAFEQERASNHAQLEQVNSKRVILMGEAEDARKRKEREEQTLEEIKSEQVRLRGEMNRIENELTFKAEELSSLKGQSEKASADAHEVQLRLQMVKQNLDREERQLERKQRDAKELEWTVQKFKQDFEELRDQSLKVTRKLELERAELEGTKQQHAQIINEIETKKRELVEKPYEREIMAAKTELSHVQEQVEREQTKLGLLGKLPEYIERTERNSDDYYPTDLLESLKSIYQQGLQQVQMAFMQKETRLRKALKKAEISAQEQAEFYEKQLSALKQVLEGRGKKKLLDITESLHESTKMLKNERKTTEKANELYQMLAEKDSKILFLSGQVQALQKELSMRKNQLHRKQADFDSIVNQLIQVDDVVLPRSPEVSSVVANNGITTRVRAKQAKVRMQQGGQVDIHLVQSQRSRDLLRSSLNSIPPNIHIDSELDVNQEDLEDENVGKSSPSFADQVKSFHTKLQELKL